MSALVAALRGPGPRFSVEFSPPHTAEAAAVQWRAVQEITAWSPVFASVTWGAGGSSQEGTTALAGRIAAETDVPPLAHLTAVGRSAAELRTALRGLARAGVRDVLALRGDPPADPSPPGRPHPGSLEHAEDLVRLARSEGLEGVAVAAFPLGHPASPDLDDDTRHLVRKIRAGADFAVAQLCFDVEDFLRLRDRLAAAGVDVPLLPGIMPITTPRVLEVTGRLTGGRRPGWLLRRLEPLAADPGGFRAAGLDVAAQAGQRLLAEGVGVLHVYSLNRSRAVGELVERLGLRPAPVR
ncbi:methylenetetrahydrofolate reductase [Kineococcus glutinatus]|uniref:Methylenetetrahydrofolate reductase n=1 Tax=Kineococcus glutinatus TaxID=1070872 RepID=A0ABP9HS73_9ACTN